MKAWFAILAVLVNAAAFAQPQAPITWGGVRWFGINNVPETFYPAALMGDTLILAGAVPNQESPPRYCPGVTYSHNNGQTFSPWQCLDTVLIGSHQVYCSLFGSENRIFALVRAWIQRSLDGGTTWTVNRPRPSYTGISSLVISGLQAISVDGYYPPNSALTLSMSISDNGGDSWRTGISLPAEIPQNVGYVDLAVTQSHILLLGNQRTEAAPLMVAPGDRNGQNWSPFIALEGPPQFYAYRPFIVADSTSETALVSQVVDFGPLNRADLHVNRTTDGGQTWDAARILSDGHPLCSFDATPLPFCRGKLWGVAWEDFWNPDSTQWGVYWRLSANHGKDWYPAQPLGLDVALMAYSNGQFVGNEVRIYWNERYHDYATMTGIMTEDTTVPDVFLLLLPTDTIRTGDTLHFLADAFDNDTLSEVRLVVVDSADVRTTVLLSGMGNHQYQGRFVVPHTGLFRYRGEAEDFWENVAFSPDTGWALFHTEGWSNAGDPSITLSASFSVSVFPNPCNSQVVITGVLPKGGVERHIVVYDLLGREVVRLKIPSDNSNTFRFPWNLTDSNGQPLATGLYFLAMSSRAISTKLMVIR